MDGKMLARGSSHASSTSKETRASRVVVEVHGVDVLNVSRWNRSSSSAVFFVNCARTVLFLVRVFCRLFSRFKPS